MRLLSPLGVPAVERSIAPLASVNCDNDDDRYDIVGCGAVGQPATGV